MLDKFQDQKCYGKAQINGTQGPETLIYFLLAVQPVAELLNRWHFYTFYFGTSHWLELMTSHWLEYNI